MKLEYMFIAAIMFSVVFVLGLKFTGEGLSEYKVDSNVNNSFGKMSNNLKSIYDYQDEMKDNVQSGEVTSDDAVDNMIKGGYSSIKSVPFSAVSVASNATMVLAKEIGYVHPILISSFITVIAILVIAGIIALIFRFEAR